MDAATNGILKGCSWTLLDVSGVHSRGRRASVQGDYQVADDIAEPLVLVVVGDGFRDIDYILLGPAHGLQALCQSCSLDNYEG